MQNSESLMLEHDYLAYVFDRYMPSKQKGLYIDNTIYLNAGQSEKELYATVAEEIAHHLTSYGDIINQEVADARRQEKKARYVASLMTVSLGDLITCYQQGLVYDWECADYLGVTREAFNSAIELYKEKMGIKFKFKGYLFSFEIADSLNIKKEN
ncbi:hypothetical protein CBF34_07200 [Vagococcus penaei]|uniref:ImmA/IrrE family metallo-endopeptidase n=1 Tax=Vagococcus penaei TaxID=633807 RepID=UPI000F879D7B|nr:ImmA/IrrE family metallo-endopeptidase [Vagococcus penaei]RSU01437.1 hypothetical protein CBF34_07200 [Vagococcus penaei]